MRVMVIIKATQDSEGGKMPSQQALAAMGAYNEELVNAGIMVAGDGLKSSATGKRVRFEGGKPTKVIDGPFAETKELVAGFWIWNVNSMDEAVEWLERCPMDPNSTADVELRRFSEPEDFGEAFTPELQAKEEALRQRVEGQA
ncbi:MAG: YciI family protein [bacterium]